jgi:DNA polymerase-1
MTFIIDADSLVYALGWVYKDAERLEVVQDGLKERMDLLIDYAQASHVATVLSGPNCFRKKYYSVSPYKGTRPDKPEWYLRLKDCMFDVLYNKYRAVQMENLEADDLCSILAFDLLDREEPYIIGSPDKDMKQIPGKHMNIRLEEPEVTEISVEEARAFFWTQMLTGDNGDAVKGVPKIGPVKAAKILVNDDSKWPEIVENEYIRVYGEEQGKLFYTQTFYTLLMLRPGHIMYDEAVRDWLREHVHPVN